MQPIERIREFVKKNLTVFDDDVTLGDDDSIFALGYVDSPFAIQLICFVEEEFKINIPDEEAENIKTVQNAVEYVKAHVN